MRAKLWLCLLIAAPGGCASTTITYVAEGVPGAAASVTYAPAADTSQGAIEVLALEATRLPVGRGAPAFYLRLRLAADNRRDRDRWLFNPNDQLLAYNGGMMAPAYVQTSAGRPLLALDPGKRGWMDLYYPLPADVDPQRVTLWWRVRRGSHIDAKTTAFVRSSGRDGGFDEYPYQYRRDFYMPGAVALGWWWPESCFALPSLRTTVRRSEEGETAASWNPEARWEPTASNTAGDWRPASEGTGAVPLSAEDAAKSSWRGGGHR
jgi:hypothetical protein